MKKLILNLTCAVAFFSSLATFAQTPGTLTVVYTPTVPTGANFYSSPRHIGAAWITTSTGAFVKTKLKYGSAGQADHYSIWTAASGGSVVDATSGATKTSFAALSFTWNGTNTSSVVVADGNYNVVISECWSHIDAVHTSTISFVKGTSSSTVTPANTSYLNNVAVIWTPVNTTGINNASTSIPVANVYPNPTEGTFNVDFKNATTIKVLNTLGSVVYEEKLNQITEGSKNIDLTRFNSGIYFVTVSNGTNTTNHKIVLSK